MQFRPDLELYEEPYALSKLQRYHLLERLGEGTFGEVRKAVDPLSGTTVAVKRVRILSRRAGIPKAVFREMEALRQLSAGEHILKLHDVYADEANLCLVLDYIESDLSEVISSSKQNLPQSHLKCYFRMILQAVQYCHARNVIHRDIKPANLLLTSNGVLKLGDFGLARIFDAHGAEQLSHQVATRQYRAPELLFASRSYTPAVDVWSAVVVMAELCTLQPLFPGNNDIDQMYKVFQVMGSPTPQVWPGVELLPDYCKVSFPHMAPLNLRLVLPAAHPDEVAFLSTMLVLDPARRLTAQQALQLSYFSAAPLPAPSGVLRVPVRLAGGVEGSKKDKPVSSVEQFLGEVESCVGGVSFS